MENDGYFYVKVFGLMCVLAFLHSHTSSTQPNTATANSTEAPSVQWLEVRGAGIAPINGIFKRSGDKAGCAWFEKKTDDGVYEIFRYRAKKSCPQVRDLTS